ncbi:unnamed protein product [Calypogeia fissa]
MRNSPLFKPIGIACMLSMARSRKAGANHLRKKLTVISLADERTILAHSCMSPMHPRGLQRHAVHFLSCRFAIQAGDELHKLVRDEFIFDRDEMGRYVRYDERLSKITMSHSTSIRKSISVHQYLSMMRMLSPLWNL